MLGLLSVVALGVVWRARSLVRRNRRLSQRNAAQSRTLAALRQARQRIGAVAAELRREAQGLAGTAAQQNAAVSQQKEALREVGESVHLVTESSRAAAQRAQSVVAGAEHSEQLSVAGRAEVTGTIQSLERAESQTDLTAQRIGALDERGEHIGAIIDSVSELAETSSMLAFNAALEAARASETGKGFLVIAREMQRLADQSKGAAGQVRGILEEIAREMRAALTETEAGRQQTRQAREHAVRAGETIAQLSSLIGGFAQAARQIAGDALSQKQGIEHVLLAVDALQSGMAEAAQAVEDMERASGSLAEQSQHLTEELQGRPEEMAAD
ncbi:MAG: methyl-accepting chemotaxis protein [Myxococcales bacterium]